MMCSFKGVGPWNNLTGACLKFAGVQINMNANSVRSAMQRCNERRQDERIAATTSIGLLLEDGQHMVSVHPDPCGYDFKCHISARPNDMTFCFFTRPFF